jgi:hypothetical protein
LFEGQVGECFLVLLLETTVSDVYGSVDEDEMEVVPLVESCYLLDIVDI